MKSDWYEIYELPKKRSKAIKITDHLLHHFDIFGFIYFQNSNFCMKSAVLQTDQLISEDFVCYYKFDYLK